MSRVVPSGARRVPRRRDEAAQVDGGRLVAAVSSGGRQLSMETTVPDPVLTAERAHLARAADCLTEMRPPPPRSPTPASTPGPPSGWAPPGPSGCAPWPPIPASRRSSAAPTPTPTPGDLPHRPPARPRRRGRPRRHRLAGADEPAVLPGQRRRSAGPGPPPPLRVRRRRAHRLRGRAPRRRRRPRERRSSARRSSGPRSGPMRDIVATIQPDQDDIVRAPLSESICVQGAPGTGKTAVGLHRAAYLLYTHGGQLARTGVLVVGPEPGVPALHRAGAAHPRRGRRRPDHGRRPDRPGAGARGGPAGGRRPQGRRPDGRGAAPGAVGRDRQAGRLHPGAAQPAGGTGSRSSGSSATSTTCAAAAAPTTTSSCCTTRPAGSGWRCSSPRTPAGRRRRPAAAPPTPRPRRAARSAEVRAFCDEVWPARDAAGVVFDL